ncbi:MAG: ATP-binding protein [Candidatus Methylacidiphilales bacterium]
MNLTSTEQQLAGISSIPVRATEWEQPPRLTRTWRLRAPAWLRLVLAILIVFVAWGCTFALRNSINAPTFQTPFFVCAIVLASWLGGFMPGIAATLLSIFALEFTFTEPLYTLGFTLPEIPKFSVFLVMGTFISWLAQRQRRDEETLLRVREGLEETVRERTADLQATNLRLTEEIAVRTRAEAELQGLNRMWRLRTMCNRAVTRSSGETELLQKVCETLIEAGGFRLVWIGYADRSGAVAVRASAAREGVRDYEQEWVPGATGCQLAAESIRSSAPAAATRSPGTDTPLARSAWATEDNVNAVGAVPLVAEGKVIGCIVIYCRDINSFDELEKSLLQLAANDIAQGLTLLQAREARAEAESALKKTERELARVARVTTMGELTASIAHEINQPLAALVTNANACLRWLGAAVPNLDEARVSVQRIVRDGTRAASVITRIRSLLSKGQPVRTRMSMNDVVDDILPLVKGEVARRHATLRTELADELPAVEIDKVQIQQVLMNLMVNGLDAMKDVSDRARALTLRTRRMDDEVVVELEDAGTGLKPEEAERLFDAFFSTKADGMGMGLSISRSILEAHEGRLWAESNPGGVGATFRFSIPVTPVHTVDSVTAAPQPNGAL